MSEINFSQGFQPAGEARWAYIKNLAQEGLAAVAKLIVLIFIALRKDLYGIFVWF